MRFLAVAVVRRRFYGTAVAVRAHQPNADQIRRCSATDCLGDKLVIILLIKMYMIIMIIMMMKLFSIFSSSHCLLSKHFLSNVSLANYFLQFFFCYFINIYGEIIQNKFLANLFASLLCVDCTQWFLIFLRAFRSSLLLYTIFYTYFSLVHNLFMQFVRCLVRLMHSQCRAFSSFFLYFVLHASAASSYADDYIPRLI